MRLATASIPVAEAARDIAADDLIAVAGIAGHRPPVEQIVKIQGKAEITDIVGYVRIDIGCGIVIPVDIGIAIPCPSCIANAAAERDTVGRPLGKRILRRK